MTKEKTKEVLKATPFETFTDKNANLKRYLTLALNNTREIMKKLLPNISVEIQKMIEFHIDKTKDDIKTNKTKVINEKAIREHIYNLVGYVAKEEKNGAFEAVVSRAMHLAIMKVNTPNDIKIDQENSKSIWCQKLLHLLLKLRKKGKNQELNFKKNTSEELVEINTGTIDTVYKIRTGKGSPKGSKTKDEKTIANNFKAISKAFFVNFDKAINYSMKKKPEFFDMVDEEVWNNLSNIFTLYNSKAYQDMRNFSQDYEVGIDGNSVIKKDHSKKIA